VWLAQEGHLRVFSRDIGDSVRFSNGTHSIPLYIEWHEDTAAIICVGYSGSIVFHGGSSIQINGDTTQVLRELMLRYDGLANRLWEANDVLERINLMFLYNFAFKGDKRMLRAIQKYNKNKNKLWRNQ
jgi:hypothetical protein